MTRFYALGMILIAACGGGSIEDTDAPPTWHQDVRQIFEETCASCHTADGGITGIPLTTYEEVLAWRGPIAAAVAAGTMPPWQAAEGCNDYQDDFSLEPKQVQTVLDWIDADTPEGREDSATDPGLPWIPATLTRVDRVIQMPEAFTPKASPDDYRCVIVEWPEDETVWITGYNFIPGNLDIVHHVIPFIMTPDDAQTFRDLDEADPGVGYTCYGGPGGDIDSLIDARWLGGWAPGSGASVMPEGYGLQVEPGSVVILQVHYNLPPNNTGSDLSGLELQYEHTPLKDAQVQPWTDVGWVLGVGMEIGPGATDVTHEFTYKIEGDYTFELHSAALHMHTKGKSARFSISHEDDTETCVVANDRWDFNWQREYWLEEPITVRQGDTLKLSCTWDNPTDKLVRWGEGTDDEMCLAVSLMTYD